jgi:chemotaxis protein MotB
MEQGKPVIIIKKKSGHGGHHGGAWKVAYADFVTAMMSLFIVLWLMNTSPKIRQAVAGYFNNPRSDSRLTGTDQSGSTANLPVTEKNIQDLKKRLEEAVRKMNDLKALQKQITITITPEGLRIELLETKDGSFFDTGSAKLNERGKELLTMLAGQLGTIPNRIEIEGHTDAQPYANPDGYDNWDLSTDRANAARRIMQAKGLRANQVSEVRGYADEDPRVPSNPLDPSNRRVTLIVQYLSVMPSDEAGGKAAEGAVDGSAPANDGKEGAAASGKDEAVGAEATKAESAKVGSAKAGSDKIASDKIASDKGAVKGLVAKIWAKIRAKIRRK